MWAQFRRAAVVRIRASVGIHIPANVLEFVAARAHPVRVVVARIAGAAEDGVPEGPQGGNCGSEDRDHEFSGRPEDQTDGLIYRYAC